MNTLQDGVREQDEGNEAAGVKLLLAFGTMSSGLEWPKGRPEATKQRDSPAPPLLIEDANIIIHPTYSLSPLRQILHAVPQRLDREMQTRSRQFK